MIEVDYDGVIPQLDYFICRHCTPNWIMNDSIISFVDLTYIFEGEVIYTINGIPYKAEKGDLICIPKNSLRHAEINPNKPMAAYAANFQVHNLGGNEISLPFNIVSKVGIRNDLLSLYQELNITWIQKDPGYAIKVRSIFLNILYKYFTILYYNNSIDSVHPRIKKAIKFIYDNYKTNIEVGDLASLVSLNSSYFGTLFKHYTGLSVKEYINRVRIDTAENMLSGGEFSVKEAAYRCGFEDTFYFSKVFKRVKGYSPSKVMMHTYVK
jgi:AraC-like DNA-binding protein